MTFVLGVVVFVGLVFPLGDKARAFTIFSGFSAGCHEGLTLVAYTQSGLTLHDQDFVLPHDPEWEAVAEFVARQLGYRTGHQRAMFVLFSLFTGVRSPDTDGHSVLNLVSLRKIHENPNGQHDHCLRSHLEDDDLGNQQAHAGCVGTIFSEIRRAKELLKLPVEEQNIDAQFTIDFYHRVDVDVWGPAYHIGRAIHAVQDSFTHTIRSADLYTIYSHLNYIEAAGGTLRESRDGMAHSDHADSCDDGARRVPSAAADATADLLTAVFSSDNFADPGNVSAFVIKWMSFAEGCSLANDYCDSPWVDRARISPTTPILGCNAVGADGALVWTAAMIVVLFFRRRIRASL